jgi:mannose-6-phosphate isomerase-like protein (cupin superfamily)
MHSTIGTIRARSLVACVLAACGIGLVLGGSAADAAPAAKEPVQRTVYGTTDPENAPGQTLSLQQVVIAPGAQLAVHFHEGTQLTTVHAGVLTYNVVSGTVQITRADGSIESVAGPKVVALRKGDALVENESLVHFGANSGKKPVVLELAALLRAGAPLSTPVGEGDAGATTVHLETTLTSQSRTLHDAGADAEKTYGGNLLTGASSLDDQPVDIEVLASIDYLKGSGAFFGFVTFTFADGSTIGTSMQGSASLDSGTGDTAFVATLGVIGGTGTYAATTGTGMFTGSRTAALGGDVAATFDLGLHA